MLVKNVFNLVSRTNETRHKEWHETCKWKCRLDANVCNNKKHWNEDKCRCQCKRLIDKGRCDKGFGILVLANVNLINDVMLENIQTMKIVNAEKNWMINQPMNIVKVLMKLK